MAEKPTLTTVAREAGVSVPTVSQVMRDTGRISSKTRQKVLETAKRLNYLPDQRAAGMRSGENRDIGFIINQLSNPFNIEVVTGAVDLLEDRGYLVSILDARDEADRQHRHVEAFIRHGRGGLLWVPAQNTPDKTFDLLASHGLPTVTFLRQGRADFDHLGIDNTAATIKAVYHLQSLGHHQIAYLGGTQDTTVRLDRITAYTRALAQHGLCAPLIWPCDEHKGAGLEAMNRLMTRHPEVTAVVCNGDMVALGACLALTRAGKTPGQDISVVGFDDIQDAAVATPPLTTLTAAPQDLGKELARLLLDRTQSPMKPRFNLLAPVDLVIRATTGPAPKS